MVSASVNWGVEQGGGEGQLSDAVVSASVNWGVEQGKWVLGTGVLASEGARVPACAGMTGRGGRGNDGWGAGSCLRRNDGGGARE